MSDAVDLARTAVAARFLEELAADRAAGRTRTLAEYQARFSGYEDLVAEELAALSDETGLARTPRDSRYELRDEIGRGGMALVLRVWDRHLRRALAMKLVADADDDATPGSPPTGSRRLTRFLDEARITGRLTHPGIVPVHDLGIDDRGRVYFTMSLIEGTDFRRVIELVHDSTEREWTLARATNVVLRVCEAVAFAHAKDIVHRDLKPENVMVGSFGETYVLDWGLARAADEDTGDRDRRSPEVAAPGLDSDELRTLEGDVIGTPAFMAPEQARGEIARVGTASDVYSIGAILYHLLSGRPPYQTPGERPSSRAVLERVRTGAPTPLRTLAQHAPPELVAICEKAMQRDPRDRYASVTDLARDLRAFLELRVVRAYETGAFAEARKWVRRNRSLAATGAAAVLALAAGMVASLVQARRADTSFSVASDAVDRLLTRVGETRLADTPQMQAVRRDVLEEALVFRRELLAQRPRDDEARVEVAAALSRVASIRRLVGDYAAAESAAREAIALWKELAHADAKHAVSLLDARGDLGLVLRRRGELDAAIDVFRATVDAADGYVLEGVSRDAVLKYRASALNDLGNVHSDRLAWPDAEAHYREAARLARDLVLRSPDDDDLRTMACNTLRNHGLALVHLERFDEAEPRLAEALATAHGRTRALRHGLGATLTALANLQRRTGRPAEARASIERAVETCRSLVTEFPSVPEYRRQLCLALNHSARHAFTAGDGDQALELIEQSVAEVETAMRVAPDDADYRNLWIGTLRTQCGVLLELGRYDRTAERARLFEHVSSPDAAAFLAVCASCARADESIPEWLRTQRADDYARRAVEMIRVGLLPEHGHEVTASWLDFLEKPEFRALRARPEVRALIDDARRR